MYLLISSVVSGIEVRPPLGDLVLHELLRRSVLILRGHPGVAPWLSYAGLAKFEGGLGHELAPPGAVLRQGCPFGEGRRKIKGR